ncbi:asparagine synthase (glutamine-hydrolyzing) [Candidatus Magnetominusculus xianensis]|uniref:asparagine synthase (glutamine-hydrolyzing) n=1 Tax=Candidatus Magnetominusculus xianensis TaxID=1748249 RepID=A0ABR5SGL4_9BACT|nr:asparagine synthase (glutamine-hydrolyzing) [Candidatus Magnetominusculus xianensis]KWT90144.1 asparagine synthetase B [Candidatus Magnetominusculus xianensis]MBF0403638.1 asparagine synthase (glutamine-hydrolyzing) [Nitrospirota bacterium]
MCGIAGFVGFRNDKTLKEMMKVISHRGNDDMGSYVSEHVSLGHQRLSIIDLSERGRQPLTNEDDTFKIIYNGEIYNYRQLRKDLIQRGHKFASDTDTEVILHLYEEIGVKCLSSLNGMFAFAIWEEKNRVLFLARDRIGIKPLYYYYDGSIFVFASEIKSILQCEKVKKRLNNKALYELLMLRYTHNPLTVIDNVYKLEPGHYLIYEQGKPPVVDAYWSLPDLSANLGQQAAQEQFLYLIKDSVQMRLISDVPVGIMLSGGIDSSAICALASSDMDNIHTFSIGFEGQKDNEFSYAHMISKQFHTHHQDILIRADHIKSLPEVIWYNDEPVGGPSSVAYYLAMKEVKKYATVLLLGHGADEIFAGYEEIKIQKLSQLLRNPLTQYFLNKILRSTKSLLTYDNAFERLKRYVGSLNDHELNFFYLISVMDNFELSMLLINEDKEVSHATADILERIKKAFRGVNNIADGILRFELQGWLSEDILLRVDRMTMSRSVEGRLPFLDYRIVEFVMSLPMSLKTHIFKDKQLLRTTMKGLLPDEIRNRTKQRFNTPINSFFSAHYDNLCRRIFTEDNELNNTIFNSKALVNLLNYKNTPSYRYILRHNKLAAQFYARQIWNILIFQLWYKMFFNNQHFDTVFAQNE